jgi:hypothetical protein
MKEQMFKQVFIKSKDDLPKENGEYFVCENKNNTTDPNRGYKELTVAIYFGDNSFHWLLCVDWYLLPVNSSEQYPDTEADGYVFCGKCGKMK